MPQEFNVLRCYSCNTFQVHQVKKAKKWNCKLCGEKQSIKKVFRQGSGYDCRQHVQKLNLLRGEQNNRDPVYTEEPENQWNDPELQEEWINETRNTSQCHEPAKWCKYLVDEADRQEAENSEDVQEETYTTDRNRFDGFYKQMKRSNKRKRQHEFEKEDNKTTYPDMYQDKSSAMSDRSPPCQTPTHNKYNSKITSEGFQKSGTIYRESAKHTTSPQRGYQHFNEESGNARPVSSKLNQYEEKENTINEQTEEVKSLKENCPQKSKWGKFVEEGNESLSEESDTEADNLYSAEYFSSSSLPFNSQDNEENSPITSENTQYSNKIQNNYEFSFSRGDNSVSNGTEATDIETNRGNNSVNAINMKSSISQFTRQNVKNGQNMEESDFIGNKENSCVFGHKSKVPTSNIQTETLSNKKPLFSVEELEDDDFDLEV